jgi:hypothetical protein
VTEIIFGHQAYGNQNPFSITNCNKGNPNINNFFPAYEHDGRIKMDVDVTPDTKWLHHVDFDNLG